MDAITLAAEDKEAIKDSLVDRGFFAIITDDQFVEELRSAESYFARNNGFVGLTHFIRRHLGDKGFDFRASFEIASRLNKQGRVQIYKVDNPHDEYQTSAIKIINDAGATADLPADIGEQLISKAAGVAESEGTGVQRTREEVPPSSSVVHQVIRSATLGSESDDGEDDASQ